MIDPVPAELNRNNLRDIFARLAGVEAFVFFGTLLGCVRDGDIIPHDDDIDIYVNARDRKKLLAALESSGFELELHPRAKWYKFWRKPLVVQATRMQDGIKTYADFYFYDDSPADYLIERWNFAGLWRDPATTIHVPKELIFPLQDAEMQGIPIRVPARPEEVCAFLYGPSWGTPVRKGEGYTMEISGNRPQFKLKAAS
ncbi:MULTISPECIES: LicD family protein [unclassified Leisingera]|uniref:LicD family protein n=1 Tax=unclassified Leisingera TaxID=2614906 RepID=UPI00030F0F5D|nr:MULTISPECIES: LicD family protein [unclassified Leisingera]KIC24564.1 hypothetical protein RA23_08365 [Leisingera sp. ANG-S3]KIC55578.1 hypothetical protein RA22_02245 [Leisingera sp. ANG-S]KID09311.1 hypothetical protein GC1_11630 [Leisingera sp. ANG1]